MRPAEQGGLRTIHADESAGQIALNRDCFVDSPGLTAEIRINAAYNNAVMNSHPLVKDDEMLSIQCQKRATL